MIHLPFNFQVTSGKTNVIALGNLDNKEILVGCVYVYAPEDSVIRIFSAPSQSIVGGRDVSSYAKSSYLGETLKQTFDAVSDMEVSEADLIKICKDEEPIDAEDGITIPYGRYLIIQIDAPVSGRAFGTITWDVRKPNETF